MAEKYCSYCGKPFSSRIDEKSRSYCEQKCYQKARALQILKSRIKYEGFNGFRVKDLIKAGYEVKIVPKPTVEV